MVAAPTAMTAATQRRMGRVVRPRYSVGMGRGVRPRYSVGWVAASGADRASDGSLRPAAIRRASRSQLRRAAEVESGLGAARGSLSDREIAAGRRIIEQGPHGRDDGVRVVANEADREIARLERVRVVLPGPGLVERPHDAVLDAEDA